MAAPSQTQTTHTDINLIQRVQRQDQHALMALYQTYGGAVYGLAMRVLQNPGMAEEVTQDVFLKLWQHPERWNPALGQFSSWLLTITRNAAIDRLRKERHANTDSVEHMDLAANPHGQHDTHWADGQLLAQLMRELPPEQRQLIELAFFHGYTHSELAQKLQLPLGTVKTRLRSGLQKLRGLWERSHE